MSWAEVGIGISAVKAPLLCDRFLLRRGLPGDTTTRSPIAALVFGRAPQGELAGVHLGTTSRSGCAVHYGIRVTRVRVRDWRLTICAGTRISLPTEMGIAGIWKMQEFQFASRSEAGTS